MYFAVKKKKSYSDTLLKCVLKSIVSFINMLKVILEAQDMAVRNHNVEYKSNLYIGKLDACQTLT